MGKGAALLRLISCLPADELFRNEGCIRGVLVAFQEREELHKKNEKYRKNIEALKEELEALRRKSQSANVRHQNEQQKLKTKIDKLNLQVLELKSVCKAKVKFNSKDDAYTSSKGSLHAYLCSNCGFWHNATKKWMSS